MAGKPNGAEKPTDENVEVAEIEGDAEIDLGSQQQTQPPADVKAGADDLQAQLDAERRRASLAEAEAARLRSERSADAKVVTDSRLAVIDSTINTKQAAKDDAMRRKREAMEAGDYEAQIKVDDELSVLNLDLKQLNLGKAEIERQIEDGKNAPEPSNAADPVERYVANMQDGKSKQWVRDHPEVIRTGRDKELIAAHMKAVAKGIEIESPQYFDLIEQELDLNAAATPPAPRREDPIVETTTAAPAAPVSRSMPMTPTGKLPEGISHRPGGGYRLSPAAAEAARISGVTPKEYVENALALQAEGRLN